MWGEYRELDEAEKREREREKLKTWNENDVYFYTPSRFPIPKIQFKILASGK